MLKTKDDYEYAIRNGKEVAIGTVGELKAYLEAACFADDEPIQLEVWDRSTKTTYIGNTEFYIHPEPRFPHVIGLNEISPISTMRGLILQLECTGKATEV